MLKRIGLLVAAGVLCIVGVMTDSAQAQCVVDTSTPTYANGKFLRYHPCDANGNVKVTGGGGGGGGAVTIADGAAVAIGATTDAAVTTNAAGTLSAKLRGLVAIFADIWNAVAHSMRVTMVDSAGNEIVVPTAGLTHYLAAAATTNATSVKASAGTLYGLSLSNTTTTVYYLRLYNLAVPPTCSSATGFVESVPIPPASAAGQVGGREAQFNIGKAFTTGVAYCITGGAGSTDNTAAAVGVFVSGLYK